MYNKIKNFVVLMFFIIFTFLVTKHYFSEKNVISSNKLRSLNLLLIDEDDLPTLENDTKDIIVYKNDLEEFKKKRKKRFWEKLISN